MKLLMINNYFESHRGGLELIGGRLARELIRRGEDVRWLASDVTPPPQDNELEARAVPVRVINASEHRLGIPFPLPRLQAIWRLAKEIRQADALLLQDSIYPLCVIGFLLARIWRKPVVIAQHVGIVPYRNRLFTLIMALLNRVAAQPMLERADRVAFFSEITAQYFVNVRRRVPAKLMFTGIDPEIFHPALDSMEKSDHRRRLGLRLDRPVALFVGRFVEKKGLHILSQMARQRPEILWVFAGWGHLDPQQWGLANVVVFRGLSGIDLVPLYQAADVFILPSKGEGFPLVIQEALACGLPVVCSADTAAADKAIAPFLSPVALDEANPSATATAFCVAIDRQLANSDQQNDSAQMRFQFVSGRYSWAACGDEYLKLIRAAVHDADPYDRQVKLTPEESAQ
jgi:alpha-maltose-1-phosphate synthase